MNTHWIKNIVLILSVSAMPATATMAAEESATRMFSEHGIVDAAPQQGVAVISDTVYHLSDQTRISTLGGGPATASDLQPGTKVGFNMYGTRAQRYISEAWILPRNFDFSTLADE